MNIIDKIDYCKPGAETNTAQIEFSQTHGRRTKYFEYFM